MRVLIAGLGSVGQRHARNLRAIYGDGLDLLAWRVRGNPEIITEQMTIDRSVPVDARLGVRTFGTLADALREAPRAAIICNPTSQHVATAIAALEAGCHVLIEKPLSHTWDDVNRLMTVADARGRVAAVCYPMRCHGILRRLRELLERGVIGRVQRVSARWSEYLADAHPYEDYRISYAARRELGGGVILCFIHELDYLIWLFGRPSDVRAVGGRFSDLDIDVEDTATITWQSGSGAAIDVRLCFGERDRQRGCIVTGTDGRIVVDLQASTLQWHDTAGTLREDFSLPHLSRNQLFVDVMTDFMAAIDGRHAPLVPVRDGAVSLRVALAAADSLQGGGHLVRIEW